MSRLCERPGCSEPGAVAYGMIPENLLFWIAPIADSPVDDPPVLCRRHADLMVVPRGWTLDDRRERFPRLFVPRPSSIAGVGASPIALQTAQQATQTAHSHHGRRRRQRQDQMPEQLVIDGTGEIPRPPVTALPVEPVIESIVEPLLEPVAATFDPVLVPVIEPEPEACFDLEAVAAHEAELEVELNVEHDVEVEVEAEVEVEVEVEVEQPGWTPDFNTDDTLNGLLKAKSPLLARTFRGTGRRR